MSTKIYYAYKWNGDIHELMTFFKAYRKEYNEGVIECLANTPFIDMLVENVGDGYELVPEISKHLTEASRRMERDVWAMDASVSVIFYKDYILVKRFGFDGLYRPKFEHEKLVDFHYQNQVDEPEDVPTEEWDLRGEIWDDILDNSETGSFAEVGLTYNFFDEADIWRVSWQVASLYRKNKGAAVQTVTGES